LKASALAADFDGTLAYAGCVDPATHDALAGLRRSGVHVILVTGRRLDSLVAAFPHPALFDRIVAENGAVLHDPATGVSRSIAPGPDARLVAALSARNVTPLNVGTSIVATREPMQAIVREVLAELGLDLHIVFNKGAVMILPQGVDKSAGLKQALGDLGLRAAEVVGVGDAENDAPFLRACGRSAAVANALPAIKAIVDIQLTLDHGRGVIELIESMWPGTIRAAARTVER
jgi:hydroxymethylpyrimidine pyrophosphatase-like HAD family hydrolase